MGARRKTAMGLRFVHELVDLGDVVGGTGQRRRNRMGKHSLVNPRSGWRFIDAALLDRQLGTGNTSGSLTVRLITSGYLGIGGYVIAKIFNLDASAASVQAPAGYLSRDYDRIFIEECGNVVHGRTDPNPPNIPVEFLRALAKKESDFNPSLAKPGQAVGLLQVAYGSVLVEYNEKYGTNYVSADRLDPRINARVACELIGRIARFLPNYEPKAFPKRKLDWTSRREVKILALAWNAGWSSRGVAGMIRHLRKAGYSASEITAELIIDKSSKYSDIDKIFQDKPATRKAWLNDIANLYQRELRATSA